MPNFVRINHLCTELTEHLGRGAFPGPNAAGKTNNCHHSTSSMAGGRVASGCQTAIYLWQLVGQRGNVLEDQIIGVRHIARK